MTERSSAGFLRALGPGLLMAGAAVGVSHLVQSTRAGAVYGFGLLAVILVANLAKYPAFRFGPAYAAATGTSLLEGYRRQGRWALWVYLLLTLGTMFTVQAAVAVVTAGLAKVMLGLSGSPIWIAAGIMTLCAGFLVAGRFVWLDRLNKAIFAVLTVTTLVATALVLPRIEWAAVPWWPAWTDWTTADLFFCAALVGWMPSAIDIAVWHSLWTLARGESTGQAPTRGEVLADFHVGYLGTVLLALCFLALGAGVMYGTGADFATTAGGFAAQVISLYTATLGDWSRPIIEVCAFAVMFSTTLAVVDGFPRALSVLAARFQGAEVPFAAGERSRAPLYWGALVVLGVGSVVVLSVFLSSLKAMVDLATTLSFLTAPVLAWLNHRVMHAPEVSAEHRPSPALRRGSWAGIIFLSAFALGYIWVRFV